MRTKLKKIAGERGHARPQGLGQSQLSDPGVNPSGGVRVVKSRAREYRVRVVSWTDPETGDRVGRELRECVRPAEYAVERDAARLALIVKTADGWRVCVATATSRLGSAISPVGLNKFAEVKRWALSHFAPAGAAGL